MIDQKKYLIFKIIIRSLATALVILGWLLHSPGQAGNILMWSNVSFWTGITITVVSFFL